VRQLTLDDEKIIATLARLSDRVAERFPGSGLSGVAEGLVRIAGESVETVRELRRPNWPIRIGAGLVIAGMLGVIPIAVMRMRGPSDIGGLPQLIQVIESAVNDVVFLGIAVFFLMTVEGRLKRRRALAALHRLRTVVHVVDMHQLTKDPERLMSPQPDTASSPDRRMTPPELGRYLDYCSELLSLSSKVAALFAQGFDDPVVLSAVNEIETLATGLSGKVWQKITLLERATARGPV
jgi:hypothetical protein